MIRESPSPAAGGVVSGIAESLLMSGSTVDSEVVAACRVLIASFTLFTGARAHVIKAYEFRCA